MRPTVEVDELVARICAMSRADLIDCLLHLHTDFPMDFSRDYLDRLAIERIQHLLLAAHLYQTRKHRAASA